MPKPYRDKTRRRRRMRKFVINEISAVDKPAQQSAVAVIMKREVPLEKLGDLADLLTSVDDGHQHGVRMFTEDGEVGIYLSYARSEDAESGHDHPLTFGEDGSVIVGENAGHTHEINASDLRNLIFSRMVNKNLEEQNSDDLTSDNESGQGTTKSNQTAEKSGGKEEEDIMPQAKEAANKTAEETLKSVQTELDTAKAELAKAKSIGELSDIEKAHYESLDDSAKEDFLSKSVVERADVIELAKSKDAVIYTAEDGSEYRKSDDPRLVSMAKQRDEDRKALKKAEQEREDVMFLKRANEECNNLPGATETHVAILKALDTIQDADVKKDALKVLKAHNSSMSTIFKSTGTTQAPTSNDAAGELEALAKNYANEHGDVNYYAAYDIVRKQHPELYEKAVNG